jgi:hypothetical protein
MPMFVALKHYLAAPKCDSVTSLQTFLSKEYACYDWTRLGLFTGSCISEYG